MPLPRLLALACVSFVALSGCTDPIAPAPRDLVGRWVSAPLELLPQGMYQQHLLFTTGRRFAVEWRSHGSYPGQPADQLSGFQRIEGTFRRDGDQLMFEPERLLWWDRFYGRNSPVRVEQPYKGGGVFEDAVFEVTGDRLTIHYFGIAANDDWVASTAVFTRVE